MAGEKGSDGQTGNTRECSERRLFYSDLVYGDPRGFTETSERLRRQPLAVRTVIPRGLAKRSPLTSEDRPLISGNQLEPWIHHGSLPRLNSERGTAETSDLVMRDQTE